MAISIQVVALQFGPLGSDGTRFTVPVHSVDTVTSQDTVEQATIRFRMPDDVDVEVQSAMGFIIPISNTPAMKHMALFMKTRNNEYLFPHCRIDYGSLAPIIVRFTALTDMAMNDDNGGVGCWIIVNGSRRPLEENISFN